MIKIKGAGGGGGGGTGAYPETIMADLSTPVGITFLDTRGHLDTAGRLLRPMQVGDLPSNAVMKAYDGYATALFRMIVGSGRYTEGATPFMRTTIAAMATGVRNNYDGGVDDVFLTDTYTPELPAILRNNLADAIITYQEATSSSSNGTLGRVTRKVFLPSYTEMKLGTLYREGDHTAYPFFTNDASRILNNDSGVATGYWTRSDVQVTTSRRRWFVTAAGAGSSSTSTTLSYGVAPVLNLSDTMEMFGNADGTYTPLETSGFAAIAVLSDEDTAPASARCFLSMNYPLPNVALKLCNNANDTVPRWVDVQMGEVAEFPGGTFENAPAIGVWIDAETTAFLGPSAIVRDIRVDRMV